VVGEENFIDMHPNRSNNFCCGGGGGFLQSGYPDERRAYGKLKADQILATKAHTHHPLPQLPRPGPRSEPSN
jgi:Fe-S oxidoreductase